MSRQVLLNGYLITLTMRKSNPLFSGSVTKGGQLQSYVPAGPPKWLLNYFDNEEVQSSV